MIRHAIYAFSIGLLVSGAIGWQFAASPDQSGDIRPPDDLHVAVPRPRPTRENLLTLQRERSLDDGFSPLSDELRKWSDAELFAALEASLQDPDCLIPGDPAQRVPQWLMAEWMRRDFEAALTWFESMEAGKTQDLIAVAVAMYWPEERGRSTSIGGEASQKMPR